jgi:hypothetical protein
MSGPTTLSCIPKDSSSLVAFLSQLQRPVAPPVNFPGLQEILQKIELMAQHRIPTQNGLIIQNPLLSSPVTQIKETQLPTAKKVHQLTIDIPDSGPHQHLFGKKARKAPPPSLPEPTSPVSFYELSPTTKKRRFEFSDSTLNFPVPILSTATPTFHDVDLPTRETIQQLNAVIKELIEFEQIWNYTDMCDSEFDHFITSATRFNVVRKKGTHFINSLKNVPQAKETIENCLTVYKKIKKQYYICTVKFMRELTADAKNLEKIKSTFSTIDIVEGCEDIMNDVNRLIGVRKSLETDIRIKKVITSLQSRELECL